MLLSLKRIFAGLENELAFSHALDLSGEEIGGCYPFALPVLATGRVVSRFDVVELRYETRFVYETQCFRCAEDIKQDFSFSFVHLLASSVSEEDEGETVLVKNETLDLCQMAATDILLELPTKFLCNSDCKGICPRCGKNLNGGLCGCGQEIDPRLSKLRQLLD